MPAYRSPAEAEIRDPVVARLRELMPAARIIHEIQSACQGPTRIDVLAVTPDRIAAVEIKSSRDKLDRLPAQLEAMQRCAHHPIVALHAKHFEVTETPWAGTWVSAPKASGYGVVWGFDLPQAHGAEQYRRHEIHDRFAKWRACPPAGAVNMLWRIPFKSSKTIRVSLKNRGLMNEFDEFMAARKKREADEIAADPEKFAEERELRASMGSSGGKQSKAAQRRKNEE